MHRKKIMKKISICTAICLATALALTGCGNKNTEIGSSLSESGSETNINTNRVSTEGLTTPGVNVNLVGDYSEKEIAAEWDEKSSTKITFSNSDIEVNGKGATVTEGLVTITAEGTYVLSGAGTDVQVVVETGEEDKVQLVLNGVSISNGVTAPVVVKECDKVTVTLAEGSDNTISDTRPVAAEDDEEELTAALFSKSDMVINGSGTLTVEGGFKDGITSKDDLKLIDGTYNISASDDAFVGKDSISIRTGDYTVNALGTAFKSSNNEDKEKGFVVVDGGTFDLAATEGDGFHGEFVLVINDGDILIRESEEGLEGMNIIINGGNIELTSTDDGVNISEAEDYSTLFGYTTEDTGAVMDEGMAGDRGFGGNMAGATDTTGENTSVDHIEGALVINGGSLYVTAQGDGLDSNGDILITGGTTVVCGPTNAGNGSLDYADTFDMTGGILAISGNQGMEQSIVSDTVPVVSVSFGSQQTGGTEVVITDENGTEMFTFTGKQNFGYVSFASADLTEGNTYTITAGSATKEGTASLSQSMGMGGMMPGGMQGGKPQRGEMPEGFDESQIPEDFDPSQIPEGAPNGNPAMPNGETPQAPDASTV